MMEKCQLFETAAEVVVAEEIRERRIIEFEKILAPGLIRNDPIATVAVAGAIEELLHFNSCTLWIDTQAESASQIIREFIQGSKKINV